MIRLKTRKIIILTQTFIMSLFKYDPPTLEESNKFRAFTNERLPHAGSISKKHLDRKQEVQKYTKEIVAALEKLSVHSTGPLYASYSYRKQNETKETHDIENLLFYNVGMPAFQKLFSKGVYFERRKGNAELKPEWDHCYFYSMAGEKPQWEERGVLAQYNNVEIPIKRVPRTIGPWVKTFLSHTVDRICPDPHEGSFGIDIKLTRTPKNFPLHYITKSMLDGLICSLQAPVGIDNHIPNELRSTYEDFMSLYENRIERCNAYALSSRKLLHVSKSNKGKPYLHWHPVDERLVSCNISIEEAKENRDMFLLSAKVFKVAETDL
jgi:hypothetical protein